MLTNPDPVVVSWLDQVPAESVWITSVTLFEARFGLALLAEGIRRKVVTAQFEELVEVDLEGRALLFNRIAAEQAALVAAVHQKRGRTVNMRDTFIAGIALTKKATLATRNTRHFN
jgi:predicted nucleic acid-binding protein